MSNTSKMLSWWLTLFLTINITTMNAQTTTETNTSLTLPQQHIVTISALTAVGDLEQLKTQLNSGLDAGLTVNEIKEILVQLYAYAGFPRSLNGITTFMKVLDERKSNGRQDAEGKAASPLTDTSDRYERGRKTLETLSKTPQAKPAPGYGEFAPRIDAFLKEHLFADIFDSDVLSYQQRELVTISALAAMDGVESQLQSHLSIGIKTGLTESQLMKAFSLISKRVGEKQGDIAKEVLSKVTADTK